MSPLGKIVVVTTWLAWGTITFFAALKRIETWSFNLVAMLVAVLVVWGAVIIIGRMRERRYDYPGYMSKPSPEHTSFKRGMPLDGTGDMPLIGRTKKRPGFEVKISFRPDEDKQRGPRTTSEVLAQDEGAP